jgi:phospholipid/cholesterol/gamma-HCH transport system substrate-binding protein
METRANYFLVGLFTIAGAIIALGVGLWVSKYATDAGWKDYEIRFSHSVSGLIVGSVVQFSGINIGTVRELYLAPEDPGQVIARVRVQADAPIRQDTVARLAMTGLTGVALIQLTGGSADSPPLTPRPGELIARIPSEQSALQKVLESSEDIAGAASEVMIRLLEILNEENAARISSILDSIDGAVQALVIEDGLIEDTARNIHQASNGLNRVISEFERVLARFDGTLATVDAGLNEDLPALTADLKAAARNLAEMAERADRILSENERALARFGTDGLSQVGPTLEEARTLLREFTRLGQRIERDPFGFIMGDNQPEEYRPR